MKTKRAIVLGMGIWSIGVLLYWFSHFIPLTDDVETQANVVLFMAIMPLVWFGCDIYYRKEHKTHGYWVGQTMLLTAVVLDALITVPLFVIPSGGTYFTFFTALGFWLIVIEFLAVAVLYWYIRVYPHSIKIEE